MNKIIVLFYKCIRIPARYISSLLTTLWCYILFYINGVSIRKLMCHGVPYIHKSSKAKIVIGDYLTLNNGYKYSESGLNGCCRIEVRDSASLLVKNNVGMSDTTITCHESITIGNNVLLGFGVHIRDTDSHSILPTDRINGKDWENKKTAPIVIDDNVFIGGNSYVLKGVSIGKNSIVGACSVVTKNIPANEIWCGNPAKYIKKIQFEQK